MKKYFSFLAMILAFTTVIAQNDATVSQTGDSNNSPVVQTGDINNAVVDQAGDNNNSSVVMTGVVNNATVLQDGDNNEAILNEGDLIGSTSDYADGTIDQTGNLNYAELNISGSGHNWPEHAITQIQVGDGLVGNNATVNQSGVDNDMDVLQIGSNNSTSGTQNGDYNQFFVDQNGTSNTATIEQNGDWNSGYKGSWGTNPEAIYWNTLIQDGTSNVGHIIQENTSGIYSNYFTMIQIGESNIVQAKQIEGSFLETRQVGKDNIIGGLLNCNPTDWLVLENWATLDATQLGDNNKLYVNTAGDLYVTQDNTGTAGVGNMIKYAQTSEGYVELTQVGDANLLWLENTSEVYDPMDVDVDQIGDNNKVASFENGIATDCAKFAGSHLDIDQLGDDNSLHLNSSGALNVVDVMQDGASNWASVVQN